MLDSCSYGNVCATAATREVANFVPHILTMIAGIDGCIDQGSKGVGVQISKLVCTCGVLTSLAYFDAGCCGVFVKKPLD